MMKKPFRWLQKHRRNITGICSVALLIALLALFMAPVQVSITSEGFLAVNMNVALAAQVDVGGSPPVRQYSPDEVAYYFDAYDAGTVWETTPEYMVDNVLTNYASTNNDNEQEKLTETTCPGTDLGTITKVELRAYGHGDGDDRIDLSFDSGQIPEYQITMPSSPDWSSYVDVTDDSNVGGWTWAKVQDPTPDLWVQYDKSAGGNILYCAKVEIRVTYWELPVSDIDVGADPLDRASGVESGFTIINKENPANASGTLHSVQVYADFNVVGLVVGTFYTTNGNTLKCRDSEAIGNVEAGAVRTFTELSITVETGDYIGCYFNSGVIEFSASGYGGLWTAEGEYIDPNDETTYTFNDGEAISLYGYGDIEACVEDITNAPSTWSVNAGSPVAVSSTYVTGLTHFTVTNNSGGTIDISISSTDMTGGNTWTLSDTATPGSMIYGLKAGLDGGDYTIIVKKNTPFNNLVTGLADEGAQDWGLKLYTPTEFTDGAGKTGTATITATCQ